MAAGIADSLWAARYDHSLLMFSFHSHDTPDGPRGLTGYPGACSKGGPQTVLDI